MPAQSVAVVHPKEESELAEQGEFLEDYQQIYNSIARRAFEMFESEGGAFGRELEHWFKAESELLHPVYLEVTESPEGFNVSAEVPGFSPKDLEISVEPRRLTIVGKRETKEEKKKGKLVYKDRLSDQLLRIVDLPAEINTDKVKATLDSGVLMLEAPKAAPAKKIAVETKAA